MLWARSDTVTSSSSFTSPRSMASMISSSVITLVTLAIGCSLSAFFSARTRRVFGSIKSTDFD